MTRESWLEQAIEHLRPIIGDNIPNGIPSSVRVSVGFPSSNGLSSRTRTVGECWYAEMASDEVPQIFISPLEDDETEVLDILCHELIHASGVRGHRADFARIARAVGLEGKPTATHAGAELKCELLLIAKRLGPYPHARLNASGRVKKKQGTRMIKLVCENCGYVVRTTRKWIEVGYPMCPDGEEMFEE